MLYCTPPARSHLCVLVLVLVLAVGLQRARGSRAAFGEFEEAPITFPPTYKYQPGTQASGAAVR